MTRQATRTTQEVPTLPSVDPGVTLLDVESGALGAIHSLALDSALTGEGPVYWVDSRGVAQTTRLADLAPEMRVLDRIRIARAFTAHQHATLADRLEHRLSTPVSLVVVPELDHLYQESDLSQHRARTLLRRSVRELASLATEFDLPIIMSRTTVDEFSEFEDYVDRHLRCEDTQFGPRFTGEDFETLVYPRPDGTLQTTLAYWAEILQARYEAVSAGLETSITQGDQRIATSR